jgi:hypothetical protein
MCVIVPASLASPEPYQMSSSFGVSVALYCESLSSSSAMGLMDENGLLGSHIGGAASAASPASAASIPGESASASLVPASPESAEIRKQARRREHENDHEDTRPHVHQRITRVHNERRVTCTRTRRTCRRPT